MSASEIRAKARGTLGSSIFTNGWLYPVLAEIIIAAILSVLGTTFIGAFLFAGVLQCALAYYYQRRARGEISPDALGALIDGGKKDLGGAIFAGMLTYIFVALWSMLFIIPGIIKSFSYAMTFYIKNDHPEYSAIEAITESRRMMNGNKMRFFVLQLSFIGWWIVGALCLGVGTLWVTAYVSAANAEFYEDLKAKTYQYIPQANVNTDTDSII